MTAIVVNKLRSDLEAAPDNEEQRKAAQEVMDSISALLKPATTPVVTLESTKGWQQDVYLPEGLEGEVPQTREEIEMGLKLLGWYLCEDFERRTSMEQKDAQVLARLAFTLGLLKVVVSGTKRVMKVKEMYQELLKYAERRG